MSKRVKRREFCKALSAIPLVASQGARVVLAHEQASVAEGKAQFVAAGKDRAGTPVAMGFSSLGYKVAGEQTSGGLFIMEHVGLAKGGGPPRHLHHEQEEWFYVIEGEIVAEVGKERFRLKAGDSVFAPRKVPHAYLYVAEKPGRLLIAFTPAGKMEAYFRERQGPDPSAFAKYDMAYVGPGLTLEEAAKV